MRWSKTKQKKTNKKTCVYACFKRDFLEHPAKIPFIKL